jgi:ABC-type multidrug transport system fused ATPase/permease subunit
MREKIRHLALKMRSEPTLTYAFPEVRQSIKKTFRWMALSELLMVLSAIPIKFFIDETLRAGHARFDRFLIIALVQALISWSVLLTYSKMGINRNDVFWRSWRIWWSYGNRAILRQSTEWHNRNGTGEKESLVGKNILRFENMFDELLFNTTPAALRIVLTCIFLTIVRWQFGIFMVLTAITFGLVLRYSEKRLGPSRLEFQERMKEVEKSGSAINSLSLVTRSMGMEEVVADRNDRLLEAFANDETPRHTLYEKCMRVQANIINHSKALFVVMVGAMICFKHDYGLSAATLAMVFDWKGRAESNFGRFGDLQHHMGFGKEALKELVDFSILTPSVQNTKHPQWPAKVMGLVMFKDIVFTHSGADEPTICGFNLKVPAHRAVAFVGESGSGKSTIMKLLERQYDPDKGTIEIDGITLTDIDYRRYRNEMIAVVSQDVKLAEQSVADNIRFARPEATLNEVMAAAKAAGAHEFIMSTENGYDTMVGENGIRLSGGQKQRIAIARALIMKPAILILDEATSALDAMSQADVQKTIAKLMHDKKCTIFIAAHRLSTIRSADQIVVMDKGRITNIGTHEELVVSSSIYKRMVELEHL